MEEADCRDFLLKRGCEQEVRLGQTVGKSWIFAKQQEGEQQERQEASHFYRGAVVSGLGSGSLYPSQCSSWSLLKQNIWLPH
jgi:hypothetical protein